VLKLSEKSNLGLDSDVSTSINGVGFRSNYETLNVGGTTYCSGK
jgi:hypothetical protein